VTAHEDRLLQDVRRVDWRFLLARPQLENAAYVGAPDSALVSSLRLTCASLTELSPEMVAGGPTARFDLLVVDGGAWDVLRHAAEWVKPGGSLYAEFARRGHAARTARALRANGFSEVTVYWHWPDFEQATRILPLDDPRALAHSILKDRRGWRASLLRAGVHVLHRARLFGWAVEHTSVVGRR
jgi:hypothetical protein